ISRWGCSRGGPMNESRLKRVPRPGRAAKPSGGIVCLAVAGLLGLSAPGAAAAQVIAIEGGTVHTIAGPPIMGATVLIRDGRIEAVGAGVQVPAGATRIDASGKIVTPGLFDSGTNIGVVEIEAV